LEVTVVPLTGLTLGVAGTYLDTKITGSFVNVDFLGQKRELAGGPLPFAPRVSLVARADYRHPINSNWGAYIGAVLNYKSSSNAGLGEQPLAHIDGYSTLDAHLGVESDRMRVGLWGRNVTDKLYFNSAFTPLGDSIARYAGMPAEYGILFSYKY
jgi:outer membrane receptor protein involved in Fe transport